eukprot:scaffold79881_cov17-Tisochrysis_lutea.AAC.2
MQRRYMACRQSPRGLKSAMEAAGDHRSCRARLLQISCHMSHPCGQTWHAGQHVVRGKSESVTAPLVRAMQINRLASIAITLHCLLPVSWVPPLQAPSEDKGAWIAFLLWRQVSCIALFFLSAQCKAFGVELVLQKRGHMGWWSSA